MKNNKNIAQAIYLTSSSFLFMFIYYLFSIDSVAFAWIEFILILPIALLVKTFSIKDN